MGLEDLMKAVKDEVIAPLQKKEYMMGCGISKDAVENIIEQGFLRAPASTKYHGNYAGGLFDHSHAVAEVLMYLTNMLDLKWMDKDSPRRIGILHDMCKIDTYTKADDAWIYNDNRIFHGHGMLSVVYSQQFGIPLNDEEIACIVYHMGPYGDDKDQRYYTEAVKWFPNVLWTHTADMVASQIMGV